jgi:hypothetical protein
MRVPVVAYDGVLHRVRLACGHNVDLLPLDGVARPGEMRDCTLFHTADDLDHLEALQMSASDPAPSGPAWEVAIVDGLHMNPQERLQDALNQFEAGGYDVQYVLPNGVNRWTVVAKRR